MASSMYYKEEYFNLSEPKMFKVTDGILSFGITATSLKELKENGKRELGFPSNVQVSVYHNSQIVQKFKDFEELDQDEVLVVVPNENVEFDVRNLLQKVKIDSDHFLLFSDREMVTLAELDVDVLKSEEDEIFLEEIKEAAVNSINEEQELRDSLGLVYLDQQHHKVNIQTTTSLSSDFLAKENLELILRNPGKICDIRDTELEALTNLDTDEFLYTYGPCVNKVSTAARRRLTLKRQIQSAEYFLESKQQKMLSETTQLIAATI